MSAVPAKPKPISIDQLLAERFGDEPEEAIPCHEIELFDQTFRIREDVNAFNLVQLGNLDDTAVIAKMMINSIHPEDRNRFKSAIMTAERLTVEKLLLIFETMVEVASGGRPTVSSPASKGGTQKKVAKRPSAASSSGRALARRN